MATVQLDILDEFRPRMLDAYCCSGAATAGYRAAGWHVTGIDIDPQPDYCGDDLILGDAVEYIREHGHEYDFIHASPPCQDHTTLTKGNRRRQAGQTDKHVNLIPSTRTALESTGRPWVIENVVGARAEMRADLILCGLMFDLRVFRHRLFEVSGLEVRQPVHPSHDGHRISGWRHGVRYDGDMVAVYGDGGGKGSVERWRQAMGITHTADRASIAEAIPPAYAEHIGRAALTSILASAA